jgi:hypothetical protein
MKRVEESGNDEVGGLLTNRSKHFSRLLKAVGMAM